ncbi:CRE-TWK-29 protein, partial [Aphelenchoides avenae]
MLNGRFDFINGLYYSYLCFTAIEYGKLIPDNVTFIPIALAYMCIGLALSTIALDIVSAYVRRLYYVGREAGNLENVLVWVGYKRLRVKELLSALGVTIGLNPATLCDLDLEQLVHDAIQVKEGKLDRVPQGYKFLEGIWPPELIPMFIRDGRFPEYIDAAYGRMSVCGSIVTTSRY